MTVTKPLISGDLPDRKSKLAQSLWTSTFSFLLVLALSFRIITLSPVVELVSNNTSYNSATAMDVYDYSMGYSDELLPLAVSSDRAGADGFTAQQISHLDDTRSVFSDGIMLYRFILLLFHVGVFWCLLTRRRDVLYKSLKLGGIIAAGFTFTIGLLALISFTGAFTVMHEVLFRNGNWQFDAGSLLIQALPAQFWATMAAVWGGIALVLSVGLFVLGRFRHNRRYRNAQKPNQ